MILLFAVWALWFAYTQRKKNGKWADYGTILYAFGGFALLIGIGIVINNPHGDAVSSATYQEPAPVETRTSGSSSYGSKSCGWCGTSFSGRHYTHLGKLVSCRSSNSSNSIGMWCSMKCCSEARKSSCPTCR